MIVFAFLAQTLRIAIPYLFAASGGVISERAGLIALGARGLHARRRVLRRARRATTAGSPWIGARRRDGRRRRCWRSLYARDARFAFAPIRSWSASRSICSRSARRAFSSGSRSTARRTRRALPGFGAEQSGTGFGALVAQSARLARRARRRRSSRGCCIARRSDCACAPWASIRRPRRRSACRSTRVRYLAAALSGVLAALGGAYLALDQHQFSAEMTAGRGFIALAATIFGRWDPLRAALACLLFAAAETLQIQLQGAQLDSVAVRRDDSVRCSRSSPWRAWSDARCRPRRLGKARVTSGLQVAERAIVA